MNLFLRFFVVALTAVFTCTSVFVSGANASTMSIQAPELDVVSALKGFAGESEVDTFSGVLTYRYPLYLPAGRNGMTPKITLTYVGSDSRYDSLLGLGWSLNLSSIYRSSKRGINTLYDRDDFSMDLFGSYDNLVQDVSDPSAYHAKNETDFNKHSFDGQSWTVTDTSGNRFTFGETAASRQVDPNDATKVYKWLLSRVEDPNGNHITFTYFHDEGQVYPEKINYTGHGSDTGLYEISFRRETRPQMTNYQRGFRVATGYRIAGIDIISHETATPEILRSYDFSYAQQNNAIQLLQDVTIKKGTETLPPTSFDYLQAGESGGKFNYLKSVTSPFGGTSSFTYLPSTTIHQSIPFPVYTLASKTVSASLGGPSAITSYDYADGHFYYDQADAYKRQYGGFGLVTVTDPIGNVTKHYFHQSENSINHPELGEQSDHISKKGRLYREEILDATGQLQKLTIRHWRYVALPEADRYHVYLEREIAADYDGQVTPKAKATSYIYDQFGNQASVTEYGEVQLNDQAGNFIDIGSDKTIKTIIYAQNLNKYIVALPSEEMTQDAATNIIAHKKIYFDGLALGSVNLGNSTKVEQLVSAGNFANTQSSYDSRGLATSVTNPNGYTTSYAYDTAGLYPAKVTNALAQETDYSYDYLTGKPITEIDPNGRETVTTLDSFGRPTLVQVSDPANPTALLTLAEYSYDLTAAPHKIRQVKQLGGGIDQISVSYLDEHGRLIQKRTEAAGTQYTVANRYHDARGKVAKEFLPVFGSGEAFTAISQQALSSNYSYDTLGRLTQLVTPLGTTTTSYIPWQKTVTDPLSNNKEFLFDARGNLIQMNEYLASQQLSTIYNYDLLGNIITQTDAIGNTRSMNYDLLGRVTSEDDWHQPAATTIPTTARSYDANGNMLSETKTDATIINYIYDALDRLSSEDDTAVAGVENNYSYDSGQYGIGRLTGITYPAGSESYGYNVLGQKITEAQVIGATRFNSSYGYDLAGNITSQTYPSSLVITNIYNAAGQLIYVQQGTQAIVSGISYSPLGQMTNINYANGVTSQDTYDPAQMYRLTSRVTTDASATKLQDLSYIYDAVGNITRVRDDGTTSLARRVDYGYDDLYRLISAKVYDAITDTLEETRTYVYDLIGNLTNNSAVGIYSYLGLDPHAVSQAGSLQYI